MMIFSRYIWVLFIVNILISCSVPNSSRLYRRHKLAKQVSIETSIEDSAVYIREKSIPSDTSKRYEFIRFSKNGQMFMSNTYDSLPKDYNNFKYGRLGFFKMEGKDSLVIEIWMNRYDKFVYFEGHFADDQLILTHSRNRGITKARKRQFILNYYRREVEGLKSIPEWKEGSAPR